MTATADDLSALSRPPASQGRRRLLLGTRNPAKERKFRWAVDGLSLNLWSATQLPTVVEPEETGDTHRQVAVDKAVFWSRHVGGVAVASDGGARIPALKDTWNSLRTRRAAGQGANDRDRADHLLDLMRGLRGSRRDLVWVEGMAVARRGVLLAGWETSAPLGRVVQTYDPNLISGGFWMAGLIRVPQFGKVYAQLSDAELAQIDHCWIELRRHLRALLSRAEVWIVEA